MKIGSDPQAATINLSRKPTPKTVHQLSTIPLPSSLRHRVSPTEFTIYRTTGPAFLNVKEPRIEHDNDTHLGFNDGTPEVPPAGHPAAPGHYAIAEMPDLALGDGTTTKPNPVPKCSPFYAGIRKAHQQLATWTATTNHGPTPPAVVITGVGFFDGPTGQPDQSPNQIELHSVLDLNLNPGSITGRVTGPSGGIAGASVNDGVDPPVTTAADGKYTIPNVNACCTSYRVTASAANFFSHANSKVAVSYSSANTQNFALTHR